MIGDNITAANKLADQAGGLLVQMAVQRKANLERLRHARRLLLEAVAQVEAAIVYAERKPDA